MAFPRRAGPEAFGSLPSGAATATTAAARRGREVGLGRRWCDGLGTGRGACGFACVPFFFPGAFRLRQVCSVARARPFMTGRVVRRDPTWQKERTKLSVPLGSHRPAGCAFGGVWDSRRVCRGRIRLALSHVVWVLFSNRNWRPWGHMSVRLVVFILLRA
jgi:hypothetical protein